MSSLTRIPLAELRRRYAAASRSPSAAVLDSLGRDPRAGARALALLLESRSKAAAEETRRLRRLFREERALRTRGLECVAGVDEVGMGPLAGPVVAAAVVLAPRARLRGLDDSKQLTAEERERLDREIRAQAPVVGIGEATPEEIDRINIYHAGLLAMRRAVAALGLAPELVLVDGRQIPELGIPQRREVGGDARIACIAAASIVAKVWRDARMRELDLRYPGYGLARHVGYATAEHRAALVRLGPSPVHRRSFAAVAAAAEWARPT